METVDDSRGTNRVLLTCDAESDALLYEELRRVAGVHLPGQWLDTGDAVQGSILLVESDQPFAEFGLALEDVGSIFARHLSPVEFELDLRADESDLATIVGLIPELSSRLDPAKSFSVQSRILGEGKLPYRKVVLNETLSQAIEESTGATMDCRRPQQVVSVLCTPATAYLGVSPTEQNRSEWPGGRHRFKKDDDQISRAEFKLLEALSVFDLELPSKGRAIDIGASPGGWTRILAEQGLLVDAVDPAELDPRLKGNRRVSHIRKRIQEYPSSSKPFEIVVNDMKMDARDSIEIMLEFGRRLVPEGLGIMTLKMPKSENTASNARITLDMLRQDLQRLSTGYRILGARQLYHNRSEVTVALRRR